MNRDEITRIIQDNGLFHGTMALGVVMDADHLERFVKLIVEAEREACAKVCEQPIDEIQITDDCSEYKYRDNQECADAIRERGAP